MEKIYLDHAATSPIHPKVVDKMTTVLKETFGNPSSIHAFGREARQYLDEARTIMAEAIGAHFNEIIFTSGGTEADNMAIIGAARALKDKGNHIITTSIEHHAVLHTCQYLEKEGFEVTYLPVDEQGKISLEQFDQALRDDTIVVTIMFGNNEVGTIQPIREIGQRLKGHQAVFHTDAVQAFGMEELDVNELHVDMLSVSAHKVNGPKGIGFLYVREGTKLIPHIHGGEQERKRRAGTENVASIAGFGEAVTIAQQTMAEKRKQYQAFKQKMIETFRQEGIEFDINGTLEGSLPHVINVYFPGVDVEAMLVNLDLAGIAASSGSACTAGSIDPSHVLVAMFGKYSDRLRSSIRFSFGLGNTLEQVEKAAKETANIVKRLRK
ncbi:cysteine desulfurase family protein [Aeribacillus pallidus]|uniref:cysteine desulfurase family protein n=1 Tax=Aeribacillus pallidus TaxID=33936 RepID=UPI003D224565